MFDYIKGRRDQCSGRRGVPGGRSRVPHVCAPPHFLSQRTGGTPYTSEPAYFSTNINFFSEQYHKITNSFCWVISFAMMLNKATRKHNVPTVRVCDILLRIFDDNVLVITTVQMPCLGKYDIPVGVRSVDPF